MTISRIEYAARALITACNESDEFPLVFLKALATACDMPLVVDDGDEPDDGHGWMDITTFADKCHVQAHTQTTERRYKPLNSPDAPWSSEPPVTESEPLHDLRIEGDEHVCTKCGRRWGFDDMDVPPCV